VLGMRRVHGDIDMHDPAFFGEYFRDLYRTRNLDAKEIQRARAELRYKSVDAAFQMIDDAWSTPVVVPYGRAPSLLQELEKNGPSRRLFRSLQRYTVNVSEKWADEWLTNGCATNVAESVLAIDLRDAHVYDDRFGLVPERFLRGGEANYVL
ncbi:MAG: CRISPR-associated endonuclease Cas3'', partial [Myxococcales bacterium]|nr:CRISPR-associated endonuclease Cas3'' [Myxococcales bacterium]